MENFKFYFTLSFALNFLSASLMSTMNSCEAGVEGAPSRRTIFRWFKEFKDDADAEGNADEEEASGDEQENHEACTTHRLTQWGIRWRFRCEHIQIGYDWDDYTLLIEFHTR